MSDKSVVAICPGGFITGGPELIHQFVDAINQNGGDASIVYFPFDGDFEVPEPYSHYNVRVCKIDDLKNKDSHFVIPEVATGYIKKLPGVNFHIWWLSVDNYFSYEKSSCFYKLKLLLKKLIRHPSLSLEPLTIKQLTGYKHWVQSYYAKEFLESHHIESKFLSDFLSEGHLRQEVDLSKKKNIICYNPKKGANVTNRLIKTYPNYNFVPIQNMTAKQVSELLQSAKIYIDFGNHPGKDRIPREAAMAKCVVITGRKGSAKNEYDIKVDPKYKVDEESERFYSIMGELIQDIFDKFDCHLVKFEPYINNILSEKKLFNQQVLEFMDNIKS